VKQFSALRRVVQRIQSVDQLANHEFPCAAPWTLLGPDALLGDKGQNDYLVSPDWFFALVRGRELAL
jgi:hypothetical protein